MKKIRISELPLSESTKGLYLLATDSENKSVKVSMDSMSEERAAADEELLLRIKGVSKRSTAYTDPSIYIGNFDAEKNESGGIKKTAVLVMQDFLRDTVRHDDFHDSFPYIGKMRGHVQGVPIEAWNYVKSWNTGSTDGVFVQVVRTNYALSAGVISSALTDSFHEYYRTVTVGMANGSVTDVTATPWKESTSEIRTIADEGLDKADSALSQIHEERQERASQDRTLSEAVSNERTERTTADAELSVSISAEEAARTQRDAELTAVLTAETNARLTADRDEKEARKTADDELSERITSEAASREASDAELQAKMQDHEDRIWKLENQWYGVEWDTEVSSPAVTRIGNMDLHRTLPIQSRMRGCLLNDNGKVVEYLNAKDWTGHDLSGARGQVMVEIPFHYRRFETDGTKRRVKMSEYPLPGFNFVKMGYLSANEATIQRSTGKLASVVNYDPDFRGGNNQAELDGTYKSVLGKPANNISLKTARDAARKRGKEGDTQWNCYTYDLHVTLTWLYVVEYATRNSQLPFNAELTSEGFHQGGLGSFSIPTSDYNSYFKNLPVIPCGCTHHLGNGSGVVNLHLATDDGTYVRDILVPRYRGVEVPFGHLSILADGIFCKRPDTSSAWTYYATSDPAVFGSDDTTQYRVVGLVPSARYGWIKDIHFGEQGDITTSQNIGGSSTTFFSDFYEIYTSNNECFPRFGGVFSQQDARNGFFYLTSISSQTASSAGHGTRLCFLPSE